MIDFHYDTAWFFGIHERELHPYFRRLVTKGCRCFDVGGYRGWHAITFAKMSGSDVVTFEAQPKAIARMERSFACTGLSIKIVPGFVSQTNDERHITLDRAADDHFVPDFIKMDIDGGEAVAFRGATRILSDRKPSLVIEVHSEDMETDCLEQLRQYGYDPVRIEQKRGRIIKESRGKGYNRWLVCEGRR